MPSASESAATTVTNGVLASVRKARRRLNMEAKTGAGGWRAVSEPNGRSPGGVSRTFGWKLPHDRYRPVAPLALGPSRNDSLAAELLGNLLAEDETPSLADVDGLARDVRHRGDESLTDRRLIELQQLAQIGGREVPVVNGHERIDERAALLARAGCEALPEHRGDGRVAGALRGDHRFHPDEHLIDRPGDLEDLADERQLRRVDRSSGRLRLEGDSGGRQHGGRHEHPSHDQ